jgi:hypothetical protein
MFELPKKFEAGRILARTGCVVSKGAFRCATGDCLGGLECALEGIQRGGQTPASLAEFTLNGHGAQDYYDVSLVDGYNLMISIKVQNPNNERSGDINDPNVIAAAQFAINQLYGSVDYKIVSVQIQVVSGTNYFLIINLPNTGQQCQITVYDRFGNKSITSNICTTCPGCKSYVNVNDTNVVAASNYVIANGPFPFSFSNYRLVNPEQQTVAGIKYYLRYIFPDNGYSICDVEVICESWMQPQYSIVSISCPGTAGIN